QNYYQHTASNSAAATWRTKLMDRLSRWRLPMLACATALLLLVVGLSIWRREQAPPPQSSQNRPQREPVAAPENPAPPKLMAKSNGQRANPGQEKPRQEESLAINLDLNRRHALGDSNRGGSLREAEIKIKLPPQRALLKLRLREGSEAGLYQISIVDPNSNPLVKTSAHSHDGNSLEAVLDLRLASPTAHRLRIECGDDLNEYLIEIEKP
ncbi:MAG TPA: hypothetical protein VJ810_11305, partial [Blastocatellia bacterium]|nr:hypothetical protein [Blastocatellia bacterium]